MQVSDDNGSTYKNTSYSTVVAGHQGYGAIPPILNALNGYNSTSSFIFNIVFPTTVDWHYGYLYLHNLGKSTSSLCGNFQVLARYGGSTQYHAYGSGTYGGLSWEKLY